MHFYAKMAIKKYRSLPERDGCGIFFCKRMGDTAFEWAILPSNGRHCFRMGDAAFAAKKYQDSVRFIGSRRLS